jgi:hypothetical protein
LEQIEIHQGLGNPFLAEREGITTGQNRRMDARIKGD